MEKFLNLKQGTVSVKEYALKFNQLSRYALYLVANMRVRMRKFASRLSQGLILESNIALLIKDIEILRLVVHMKQMKDEKRK